LGRSTTRTATTTNNTIVFVSQQSIKSQLAAFHISFASILFATGSIEIHMASLSLPAPRNSSFVRKQPPAVASLERSETALVAAGDESQSRIKSHQEPAEKKKTSKAPNYEQRCKAASDVAGMTPAERKAKNIKLFVPRSLEDFDDGGSFPEIHVAQYPRHLGNPHLNRRKVPPPSTGSNSVGGGGGGNSGAPAVTGSQTASRAIVNVEVDKDGEISYDAIVKGGTNSSKTVYTRYEDLRGGQVKPEDVALPTEEEEEEAANRTNAALQKLIASKTALNKPSGSAIANADTSKDIEEKTEFIKYTPRPDAPGYNPAAAQRVIQMVPKQVDPMMPPKHKHVKVRLQQLEAHSNSVNNELYIHCFQWHSRHKFESLHRTKTFT
jgi:SKIP/SNW domain